MPEYYGEDCSSKKPEIVSVDGISLAASSHEKLLGVTIDSELKFENHITELCLPQNIKIYHKISKILDPCHVSKKKK